MRRLSKPMGVHAGNRQLSTLASREQIQIASEAGVLMARVASNTYWECSCLTQALCVKRLLNFYQVPSVLYLGALFESVNNFNKKTNDKNRPHDFKAHAWVDVHSTTIIGGPQNTKYQVVATFMSLSFD